MKLIERYLLREFLVPIVYCMATFVMIYLIIDLSDSLTAILKAEPSVATILTYYACTVVMYIELLLPAALLLATLYTMWNLSRNSELTAMRANGISFGRLVRPFLGVALVMSLLAALSGEFVVPEARRWAEELRLNRFVPPENQVQERVPYYSVYARRYWVVDELDLRTPQVLKGVRITGETEHQKRDFELDAARAEFLDGMWWLWQPRMRRFDERGQALPYTPDDAMNSRTLLPAPQFSETPRDFVIERREWEYLSLRDMLRYLASHPQMKTDKLVAEWYDVHYRLAAPWSCLVITLFAIPAGISSSRQGVLKGIILALTFFFSFYALTQACLFMGKQGIIPPWLGAWLPNAVFLVAGMAQLRRLR